MPGPSRQCRVPPSADVPSGNTLGSITREVTSTLRPRSSRASPHFSSPIGSKPPRAHHRPGGRRFPPAHGSAPLHRRPPRRPHPPREAPRPRPPASCLPFVVTHSRTMPPASRKNPAAKLQESASGASNVSSPSEARAATSGRYGVKCCPRHSRRFRAPIVACAAWSFLRDHLTPRPAVARGTYRFCVRKIRWAPALQKTSANHGAGNPPSSGAGRSRLGKHGSSRHLLAASGVASIRHPHSTPAIPRPWPQRCGVSQNSSPHSARPHPRSTERSS